MAEEVAVKTVSTSPSTNVMQQPDGTNSTSPIEDPTFTIALNLKQQEFKEALDRKEGFTITSPAFDAARRSFHVKIDVD